MHRHMCGASVSPLRGRRIVTHLAFAGKCAVRLSDDVQHVRPQSAVPVDAPQHYEAFKRRVHGANTLRSQADREEALGALCCGATVLCCAAVCCAVLRCMCCAVLRALVR